MAFHILIQVLVFLPPGSICSVWHKGGCLLELLFLFHTFQLLVKLGWEYLIIAQETSMIWMLSLHRYRCCSCISYLLWWKLISQGMVVWFWIVQFRVDKRSHIFYTYVKAFLSWDVWVVIIVLPLIPCVLNLDLIMSTILVAALLLEPRLCPFVLVFVHNETVSGRVADQVLLVQLLDGGVLGVLYLVWGRVCSLWLIYDRRYVMLRAVQPILHLGLVERLISEVCNHWL